MGVDEAMNTKDDWDNFRPTTAPLEDIDGAMRQLPSGDWELTTDTSATARRAVVPPGEYAGLWDGRTVKFEVGDQAYEASTSDGDKKPPVECTVVADDSGPLMLIVDDPFQIGFAVASVRNANT